MTESEHMVIVQGITQIYVKGHTIFECALEVCNKLDTYNYAKSKEYTVGHEKYFIEGRITKPLHPLYYQQSPCLDPLGFTISAGAKVILQQVNDNDRSRIRKVSIYAKRV